MTECCLDYYPFGCFASCACIELPIVLPLIGEYTIKYWYNGNSAQYELKVNNQNIGDRLKLPFDIFNYGKIYFQVISPFGDIFYLLAFGYDLMYGGKIQKEYNCFSVDKKIEIGKQRNECYPVECGDCGLLHDFAIVNPFNNYSQQKNTKSAENTIFFTKDICCEQIQIKGISQRHNGNPILENILIFSDSRIGYNGGFLYAVDLTSSQIVSGIINIEINFVCLSKKGLNNNDCESAVQTAYINISVL